MEKPILKKLKIWREGRQEEAEKASERRREEKIRQRQKKQKEEEYIRDLIFDTQEELNKNEKMFRTLYLNEIDKARMEAREGKKDSKRYAKIGVAFYSNQIIQAAKVQMEEQKDNFELKTMMEGMQQALAAIQELSGEIGTWNVKKIKKEAGKLSAASKGGDRALADTLNMVRGLELPEEGKMPIERLVDYDTIEKWISDPVYAQKCWKNGEGASVPAETVLETYADLEKKLRSLDNSSF